MNEIKDGGPAFPTKGPVSTVDKQGITLRDYFAAKAMQGMLANSKQGNPLVDKDRFSEWCYQMADAMLEERKK